MEGAHGLQTVRTAFVTLNVADVQYVAESR